LVFFLHGKTYKHAEAFASSFLHSCGADRAFQCAKACIATLPGPGKLDSLIAKLFLLLSYALWHEAHAAGVLLAHTDTYRAAFAFMIDNGFLLSSSTRLIALTLFANILCGRTDRPSGSFENEMCQALGQIITCNGHAAFSALFWEICHRGNPTELTFLQQCTMELFHKLSNPEFSKAVERSLSEWCYTETRNSKGFFAGFYTLFLASLRPRDQLLDGMYGALAATVCYFLEFLEQYGSPGLFEQAIRYPYSGCENFALDDTWLYKYLQAVRKTGSPEAVEITTCHMRELAKYATSWATEAIQLFEQLAAAKQSRKLARTCALPGCKVTSTVLCPLRKCSRCQCTYYCTSKHQRDHWPTHKKDCVKPASAVVSFTRPLSVFVCAFPGCSVASTSECPLRTCGRCMAVCYCGPDHQRAHWPAHKQSCVKPPPAVTTDTVLDALSALSEAVFSSAAPDSAL
jgi:hypothetical protein